MTIRLKMLLAIMFTVFLTIAGVLVSVSMQMRTTLTSEFHSNSKAQLERMNSFVDLFFSDTMATAEYLGRSPAVLDNVEHLTSYLNVKEDVTPIGKDLPLGERQIYDELTTMASVHPAYQMIYVGHSNAGFTQTPDTELGAGYNPPDRPWFKAAIKAGKPVVTDAYLSDVGGVAEIVCTVAAPIDVKEGQAVVGIDIGLETLSKELGGVRIGHTGYVMLIDNMGLVIVDPRSHASSDGNAAEREWLGKSILPPSDPAVEEIAEKQDAAALQSLLKQSAGSKNVTFSEITLNNHEWLAGITYTESGWAILVLQSKEEIFSDAFDITFAVLQVGIGIAFITALIGFFIARTIARPVTILATAAQSVSNGNFDAIPKDNTPFKGELRILHTSLQSMVAKLIELIQTAEGKIKEAEEALGISKKALADAKEAEENGERARKEGIQQAAEQLGNVIQELAATAENLSAEVKDTEENISTQRERVSGTALAMSQMNTAVAEVASSISRTSSLADKARSGAIQGKELVQGVVESISEVEHQSNILRTNLEELGKQATDIGQVMVVINDIADQTNLLALNAAIEAARAGEAGRGFAVVADEVRKLAEKTMLATKEVGDAIVNIQKGTENNRTSMQAAAAGVEKSTAIAHQAGEALTDIEKLVTTTADEVSSIATASEEQSATAEEINRSTEDVNELAQLVKEGAQRTSGIAEDLVRLANHLNEVVENLRKG